MRPQVLDKVLEAPDCDVGSSTWWNASRQNVDSSGVLRGSGQAACACPFYMFVPLRAREAPGAGDRKTHTGAMGAERAVGGARAYGA